MEITLDHVFAKMAIMMISKIPFANNAQNFGTSYYHSFFDKRCLF